MRLSIPLLCLFTSGFAGLVYEVCWIRQGTLVFGSTTLSTSTVLAVFFAGLALGSFLFGRLSARSRNPIRWYAGLELGIAIFGLASLLLFPLADGVYGRLFRALGEDSATLGLLRVVLVSAILLPAATGMGATLPLMCAAFSSRARPAANPVAVFYGINTLGAAIGAAAAGLLLIPTIGVTRAIALAALCNVLAAALAWTIRAPGTVRSTARPGLYEHTARPRTSDPRGARDHAAAGTLRAPSFRLAIAVLFFLSGFVALAHEVLWTRYLGLLVRNTVYTFTISLTVVLTGIVVGSLLASIVAPPPISPKGSPVRADRGAWIFGLLQILIGLYVLTLMLLPPVAWQKLGTGLGIYFLLLLPPAVFSGASFPLAVRLVAEDTSTLGYEVGRMAALNITGGIAGSLLAGFVGLPRFGLQTSILLTTGVSLAVGIAAWFPRAGHAAARARRRSPWPRCCCGSRCRRRSAPAFPRTSSPTTARSSTSGRVCSPTWRWSRARMRSKCRSTAGGRARTGRPTRSWPLTSRCCFIPIRARYWWWAWAPARPPADSCSTRSSGSMSSTSSRWFST